MADVDDTALPTTRKAAQASGSMFYAPGSQCVRGHIEKRRTKNGTCFACENSEEDRKAAVKSAAAWKLTQDPDRVRALNAASARRCRLKDIEGARERGRVTRANIPHEVLAARQKSWQRRNAEHINEYNKAYQKKWRLSNPEKAKLKSQAAGARRQAALYNAPGTWDATDVQWLMAEQGGMCAGFWCYTSVREDCEVDHRDPVSRGGSNWPSNLALLCQPCNRRKSARTMPEWFQSLGGYKCQRSM